MPFTDTVPAATTARAPYLAVHDPHRRTTVLADADRTGGALGLVIQDLRAHEVGAWRRHAVADVAYLVLEGDVEFRVGHQLLAAAPLSLVLTPRGAAHCYRAHTDARLALLAVPAGVERFVEGSARAVGGDAALVLALAQEHRVELLPEFLPEPTPTREDLP